MGVKQCNTRAIAGLFQPSITHLHLNGAAFSLIRARCH